MAVTKCFLSWKTINWTQLNSTDPVEQRTAKSVVFLFMSQLGHWFIDSLGDSCSRCERVDNSTSSWVELCRYKHPLRPRAVIWCLRCCICVMDSPALRTSPCLQGTSGQRGRQRHIAFNCSRCSHVFRFCLFCFVRCPSNLDIMPP